MAITEAQVLAAVEKYLPKTANFAQSATLGEIDLVSLHSRIQKIILTSLLVDADAIFYMIYLASRRLALDVKAVITLLDLIDSVEVLRGLRSTDPRRIADYAKLESASVGLTRLSSGVAVDGVLSPNALAAFEGDLEGFMRQELKPNVAGGNRALTSKQLRTLMSELKSAWASVLAGRASLFSMLSSYIAEDIRSRVSADVISGIQGTIQELLASLPDLTTEAQAEGAERILVDLAAAEAAIRIIGSAPNPVGTVHSVGSDAYTLSTRLVASGVGEAISSDILISGVDGKLGLVGPGLGGASLTGLGGQTVAPGSGIYTSILQDASVSGFPGLGVTVGMYLTFVDTGMTHVITSVSAQSLALDMPTRHRASTLQRYAITSRRPGSLLHSTQSSFWVEPGSMTSVSASIAHGWSGGFLRNNKMSKSDGTNIVTSGTSATLRPRKAVGSAATQSSTTFTDLAATFLTDRIEAGDSLAITSGSNTGTHSIVSVDSETSITTGTTFTTAVGTTWNIEAPNASSRMLDANATLITLGIGPTHEIDILGSTANTNGLYPVVSVSSQVDATLFTVTPLVYEAGVSWRAGHVANDVLYSPSSDFIASGVLVGDLVDVAGGATLTVVSVTQTSLSLSSALPAKFVAGLAFSVYSSPGTYSDQFSMNDSAVLEAFGVSSTYGVVVYVGGVQEVEESAVFLHINGASYRVHSRISSTSLKIHPFSSGSGGFTSSSTFSISIGDASGLALSSQLLVITSGTNAGSVFTLASSTATSITVYGTALLSSDDVFEVWPKTSNLYYAWYVSTVELTRNVRDVSGIAPFTSGSVGMGVVWDVGGQELYTTVDTYISPTEVWLSDPVPSGITINYAYVPTIRKGQKVLVAGRSSIVQGVFDLHTLEIDPPIASSGGIALPFQVLRSPDQPSDLFRVKDAAGASSVDPINGFGVAFSGMSVVVGDVVCTYVRPYDGDGDGFFESFQVSSSLVGGSRDLKYQISSGSHETTSTLLVRDATTLDGDAVTVWGVQDILHAASHTDSGGIRTVSIQPDLKSDVHGLSYSAVSGGGASYGRYILLDSKNAELSMDSTTDALRLHIAQVLIDFGGVGPVAASGTGGSLSYTTGGLSTLLSDPSALFTPSMHSYRVKLATGEVAYIDTVVSPTSVIVSPPLPVGTSVSWDVTNTSISASLEEVARIRSQMSDLSDMLAGYTVSRNPTLEGLISLMEDQRMDRMLDLMYSGDITRLVNTTDVGGSYSSFARASVQAVGASTQPTQAILATQENIGPTTVSSKAISSQASYSEGFRSEVDVQIAMAQAVNDIADDELLRSLSFSTFEEMRNRAIYELSGEIASNVISDVDPTLPWIARSGSIREKLVRRYDEVRNAIQYMLDHPDEFEDVGVVK